jgi:DNA-binding PadR family transcriptional regulator
MQVPCVDGAEGLAIAAPKLASMKSPIHWALLALVIERPSYAYDLAQRFTRAYEGALSLSSISQIYTALDALSSRALVEEIPGSRETRQPRPSYRVTADGLREYEAWLIRQVEEERRRQRLMVLQLTALKRRPDAGGILDRYEQAWRAEEPQEPRVADDDGASDCLFALLREQSRLLSEAKLSWIGYARKALGASG